MNDLLFDTQEMAEKYIVSHYTGYESCEDRDVKDLVMYGKNKEDEILFAIWKHYYEGHLKFKVSDFKGEAGGRAEILDTLYSYMAEHGDYKDIKSICCEMHSLYHTSHSDTRVSAHILVRRGYLTSRKKGNLKYYKML